MADLQDYAIGTLTITLLISLGFVVSVDDNHICRERELTFYCHSLSTSGKTCYTKPLFQGRKICFEEWELIAEDILIGKVRANGGLYDCEGKDLYSICIKDDGKVAYFGELN